MTWFKVDDKLHDHRKARKAGRAAMGVWVLAGSWSADNLTDGFVPASVLPRWGTPADARKLVSVGLWFEDHEDDEDGWRFHEWLEFQPSRAAKLEEREAKAEAGRAGGFASGRSRREARTKQSASQFVEPPNPTRTRTRPSDTDVSDTPADAGDRFDDFWAAYPRKVAKGQARKAWSAAAKKADPDLLVKAATSFAGWVKVERTEERFIAHPATWLNGERWNDERTSRPGPQSRVGEHLSLVDQLAAEEAEADASNLRQIGQTR